MVSLFEMPLKQEEAYAPCCWGKTRNLLSEKVETEITPRYTLILYELQIKTIFCLDRIRGRVSVVPRIQQFS